MFSAAALADLHVGSLYAVCPAGYLSAKQRGPLQRWLSYRWHEVLDWLPPELDALLLAGDLLDGNQPAQRGREAWTVHPRTQREACAELLDPLVQRAKRTVSCWGTEYHEGRTGVEASNLAYDLGIEDVGWHGLLDLGGLKTSLAHGQPFSVVNPAYGLMTELRGVLTLPPRDRASLILRGHLHRAAYLVDPANNLAGISLPCFQARTGYMSTKSQYRAAVPTVGATRFFVDDEGELVFNPLKDILAWEVPSADFS